MTLIIETGTGIRNANSYVDIAYVSSYLTNRGRETENLWSTLTTGKQEAAIISATDYIEKRFGYRFKGLPKFTFQESFASAKLTFSGLPTANQTLQIGDEVYKFVSALTGVSNEVLIGASATATANNLVAALSSTVSNGVLYGLGTLQNRHVSVSAVGGVVTLVALATGYSGNLTALVGTVTNLSITGFSGGRDGGMQPLHFPANYCYDELGVAITGIPDKLKQAIAEYSVRAVASSLLPDLSVDSYGGRVIQKTETVGPITESTKYDSGSGGEVLFKPFPAADKLLSSLLVGGSLGGVIRG